MNLSPYYLCFYGLIALLTVVLFALIFIEVTSHDPLKRSKKAPQHSIVSNNILSAVLTMPDLDPRNVISLLIKCRTKHPSFTELFDACLAQITDAKDGIESFTELINANNINTIDYAAPALAKAQQIILRNLMVVANRGMIIKTSDTTITEDAQSFERLIKKILEGNNQILELNREFLIRITNFISDKGVETAGTTDTKYWVRALEGKALISDIFDQEDYPKP